MRTFIRFARDESGATAIEYALLACMVAIVIIAALTQLGTSVSDSYGRASAGFK